VGLLDELASIWVNDEGSFRSSSRGKVERVSKLVTVEDILNADQTGSELGSTDPKPALDVRGLLQLQAMMVFGVQSSYNQDQ